MNSDECHQHNELTRKESIGYSPSQLICSCHGCPVEFCTFEDNLKSERTQDTNTGSWQFVLRKKSDSQELNKSLESSATLFSPLAKRPRITYLRMRRPYKAQDSSWENSPSIAIALKTGKLSGTQLNKEKLMTSLLTSECDHTPPSNASRRTTCDLWQLREKSAFLSARLEWESRVEHGKREAWMPIQKTPVQSSGMDTKVKSMLSLMSSEDKLEYHTSSDGLTGIPYALKQKEVDPFCVLNGFGSQVIYLPPSGTQISMHKLKQL